MVESTDPRRVRTDRGLYLVGMSVEPPRPRLNVDAVRGGPEIVDALAEDWRLLLEEAEDDQPFYRPEWIGAYARAFASGKTLVVITARAGRDLKAVLPLVEERGLFSGVPVRKWRSAVNAHPGRFEMVCSAGPEGESAASAVWEFLREHAGWDILEFLYVPQGGALDRMVQLAARDGYPTAALPMPSSPYVSMAGWNDSDPRFFGTEHKFQKDLRRRLRNLAAEGSIALEQVDGAEPQALENFYRLEGSGWKAREGSAISSRPETRQFYGEVAKAAGRFGYLTLYTLRLDERMIAGHFGLSYRGCYFSPKIAFDESFRKFAPGHLIVHHILHDRWERGLREYDITGDADEWKSKWATGTRVQNHCFIFQRSAWGRMLHALQFSVKPRVKKALGR